MAAVIGKPLPRIQDNAQQEKFTWSGSLHLREKKWQEAFLMTRRALSDRSKRMVGYRLSFLGSQESHRTYRVSQKNVNNFNDL